MLCYEKLSSFSVFTDIKQYLLFPASKNADEMPAAELTYTWKCSSAQPPFVGLGAKQLLIILVVSIQLLTRVPIWLLQIT